MRSLIWLVFLFFLLPGTLAARDVPWVEIFGGYSYFRMPSDIFLDVDHHTTEEASLNGWNVTVTGNFNRWLGAEFDFGGYSGTVKAESVRYGRPYPMSMDIRNYLFGPGFEYFAGQRGASGNDANAALNTITNTLSSLVNRGRLSGNLAFLGGVFPSTTWGNAVRATMHVNGAGNKYFIDLVNIDINYASDTEIRPTPKGSIQLVLPESLRNKNLRIRSYDADTATDPDPVVSKPDGSHLQIELNPFRLYKLLAIEASQ